MQVLKQAPFKHAWLLEQGGLLPHRDGPGGRWCFFFFFFFPLAAATPDALGWLPPQGGVLWAAPRTPSASWSIAATVAWFSFYETRCETREVAFSRARSPGPTGRAPTPLFSDVGGPYPRNLSYAGVLGVQ